MSVVRSPVRSVVRSPVRSVLGSGALSSSNLQQLLALSPSLLIWPAKGSGWQGTSGGTLSATGQPVGLLPDLAQFGGKTQAAWLAAPTTPEVVTNGDFSGGTTDGWSAAAGTNFSVVSGAARVENAGAAAGGVHQTFATVSGRAYRLTFSLSNIVTTMTVRISVNNGTSASFTGSQHASSSSLASQDIIFTAVGPSSTFALFVNSGTTGARFDYDNVSIKELPGNHLRAGTWATPADSSRALYGRVPLGGRRNLLTQTEDITNGVWSHANINTPTSTSADVATTGAFRYVKQTPSLVNTQAYTLTIEFKYDNAQWIWLLGQTSTDTFFYFDIQNGVVGVSGTSTGGAIGDDVNSKRLLKPMEN